MGLVQTENIQVTAEAYDVALDMSFPKGADGGLDFGTIRVMDESKQTCSLKNKGRYEIGFRLASFLCHLSQDMFFLQHRQISNELASTCAAGYAATFKLNTALVASQ